MPAFLEKSGNGNSVDSELESFTVKELRVARVEVMCSHQKWGKIHGYGPLFGFKPDDR